MVLTLLSPSAADGLGMGTALFFWALHVGPLILLLALSQVALGKLPAIAQRPVVVQILLAALIASLLFSPLALFVDAVFEAEGSIDDENAPWIIEALSEIAHYLVPATLVWLLINASSLRKLPPPFDQGHVTKTPEEDPAPIEPAALDFWGRVPGRLGRRVIALSAELHYLRVYTTHGDTLILFPFGQAVALLEQEDGMQIHRSHWVSLSHVDEIISDNGRMLCKVVGGPTLPVSRSYRTAFRNALRKTSEG